MPVVSSRRQGLDEPALIHTVNRYTDLLIYEYVCIYRFGA